MAGALDVFWAVSQAVGAVVLVVWAGLLLVAGLIAVGALRRPAARPAPPVARPDEGDPIEGYVPRLRGGDPAYGPRPLPVRRGRKWIKAARPSAGRDVRGADDEDILLHLLGRVAGPDVDVG